VAMRKRRAGDAGSGGEDDEVLGTTVTAGLRREVMAVDVAPDGAAALEHLASTAMT